MKPLAIPGFVGAFCNRQTKSRGVQSHVLAAPKYKSRSTSVPDGDSSKHFQGADERRQLLEDALKDIIGSKNLDELLQNSDFQGSAALRTYSSFVLPKSEGALAMTKQPQRAAVVANNIAFLMREHRSHQQEWLRNHDRSLQEAEETLGKEQRNPITLVLDDIRSAHNVGNILRAAEAARCQKVILCGSITPSPPNPKVLKTALGAAEYVPYKTDVSTMDAIQNLKQNNVKVFGVETTSRSIPLWQASFFSLKDKESDAHEGNQIAFVFGNEVVGVDTNVLEECDGGLIAVPTHGIKNSLNVATCASVVTWEALRQWDALQHEN